MASVDLVKPARSKDDVSTSSVTEETSQLRSARRLVVTGGKQGLFDYSKPEWHRYCEARVAVIDTKTGRVEVPLTYIAQPDNRPARDPSIVFKAASPRPDGGLLVANLTEVLSLDENLAVQDVISLPYFNDVHHVAMIGGRLHVVSTGLDSLVVLDEKHEVAEVRHALGEDPWQSFDRNVDYRKIPSTKPHRSHPNFVFANRFGVWLTRFEQQDAVCLDDPTRRIDLAVGNPHDGVQHEGATWFTTTNGHLLEANVETGQVDRCIDLNDLDRRDGPLGWCRGVHRSGDVAYVGFTHFRRTRLVKNLRWVKERFHIPTGHVSPPTRVTAFDLSKGSIVNEWELKDVGMDAIFSILPWG